MVQSADMCKHDLNGFVCTVYLIYLLWFTNSHTASLCPVIGKKLCKFVGCCLFVMTEIVNNFREHVVLQRIGWRYGYCLNLDVRIVAIFFQLYCNSA